MKDFHRCYGQKLFFPGCISAPNPPVWMKWSASLQRFSGMQKADMFTVVRAQTKEPLEGVRAHVRAYVHACTARLELWNSQHWNKFQKPIKHFSSQNAGLKKIKKRETFWVKQRCSHPPLQGGGGAWTVWRARPWFPTMHCITWHRNGSGGLPASSPGRLLSEHRTKATRSKLRIKPSITIHDQCLHETG